MNKVIYVIAQVIIIVVPIFFGIQNPTVSKRHLTEAVVVLSIVAFEVFAYSVYAVQRGEMPDLHEAIKVKIIAGKFSDGVFNSNFMKMNDYPRITNEATIAYGETSIKNDIIEKMPEYSPDGQLFEYLFLKVLNYCYHDGWYLIQKKPLATESIFISPQYDRNKNNKNILTFKELPECLRINNIFFNNKTIFKDGNYVGRKTITLFPTLANGEPFRIVLPPGVRCEIKVNQNGWPNGTYIFTHKFFILTIALKAFVAGPGYPLGFHKQNDRTMMDDMKKVRSTEMIVNIDTTFKQSLFEQELTDLYHWATTLIECFRFYFDYDEFERHRHD